MDAEETVEKIKNLEEDGKKRLERAEKDREILLANGREKAMKIIEDFEKEKSTYLQDEIKKAEVHIKKEAEKILVKAEKDSLGLQSTAKDRVNRAAKEVFETFKSVILG